MVACVHVLSPAKTRPSFRGRWGRHETGVPVSTLRLSFAQQHESGRKVRSAAQRFLKIKIDRSMRRTSMSLWRDGFPASTW